MRVLKQLLSQWLIESGPLTLCCYFAAKEEGPLVSVSGDADYQRSGNDNSHPDQHERPIPQRLPGVCFLA